MAFNMENIVKNNLKDVSHNDNNSAINNSSCQDESGFSSDNEEDDSKFREIVNGIVVDRIIDEDPCPSGTSSAFTSNAINEAVPGAINLRDDKGAKGSKRTIDGYLANILTERLDKDIELVEVPHCAAAISPKRSRLNKENVVHLLSTSENSIIIVDSDTDDEKNTRSFADDNVEAPTDHPNTISRPKKSKKQRKSQKEFEKRAQEAAVTAEWVCDQNYTRQWEDPKKENLLKLRLIRKQTGGTMECTPE